MNKDRDWMLEEVLETWKSNYSVAEGYVMHYTEIECCKLITEAIREQIASRLPEKKKFHLERCSTETRQNWEKAGFNEALKQVKEKLL